MEKEHESSTFSVPGLMQDLTLMSTPLPQASSTATKSRSLLLDQELDRMTAASEERTQQKDLKNLSPPEKDWNKYAQPLADVKSNENKRTMSDLENACKNITEMQKKVARELVKAKAAHERSKFSLTSCDNPITLKNEKDFSPESLTNSQIKSSNDSNLVINYSKESINGKKISDEKELCSTRDNFEFRVPSLPVKSSQKFYSDLDKKFRSELGLDVNKASSIMPKYPSEPKLSGIPIRKYDNHYNTKDKFSNSFCDLKTLPEKRDSEVDRASVSSSANSSLGIISSDAIEDMFDQPLTEISQSEKLDLSHRLAQELAIDTSLTRKCEFDMSSVMTTRMKEILAAKREEEKENKARESMYEEYSTLHGYSSDTSKNSTAKENTNIIDDSQPPEKDNNDLNKKKPLTERNSVTRKDSFIRRSTDNTKLSFSNQNRALNPFGDCSMGKLSIASDEFQSGEDAAERLRSDEDIWHQSTRSLSGIYGDGDISIRTKGEKLSISSFLRSGSGPLGCLERGTGNTQRPNFGHPVTSPEKKCKSRPILPPPEEKLTFLLDEIPTKEIPEETDARKKSSIWQTLIDQFSSLYTDNNPDISVPSISRIGDILANSEGLNPRDVIDQLMAASRKISENSDEEQQSTTVADHSGLLLSGKKDKLKTIPSVVSGSSSFCRGYESDRSTRYSSSFNSHITMDEEPMSRRRTHTLPPAADSVIVIDDSVAPSICNVTDFEGEGDEYVCVLTPESMDFDIFNDFPRAQHYCISKACYVNGHRQDSAALVHIPVTELVLQPGEERTLSVTVAALVGETIKFKLEVTRIDSVTHEKETNNVFGKVVAELPKISLLSPSSVIMKPVMDSNSPDFHGEYKAIVEVKNSGCSIVPVKLTLTQLKCADTDVFYFNQERNKTVTLKIGPGQTVKQAVFCHTPPIFEMNKLSGVLVSAQVDVCLATSMQVQLPPLACAVFNTQLNPNFFCAPSNLHVPPDGCASFKLYNSGLSPVTFQTVSTMAYTVEPATFTIGPRQTVVVTVTHTAGSVRRGTLTLHAKEELMMYSVNLLTTGTSSTSSSANSSFVTPQSSRAPSPSSPSSSMTEGSLQLACTHKELVWGGCTLQQRVVKTCSLKNRNMFREKLHLKITDPHNSFKILNEKSGLESEMKLRLQPMENHTISVVMLAGTAGPKWGYLTISRINSPSDKKVIPLFAFGGKAKVSIEGILQDPEQHMWLYLDPDTLGSSFALSNTGDYSAFVKISEGMSATTIGGGISISPPECILQPGRFVSVQINLYVTPERLDYLLAESSQSAICITRLTVTHGDESTRLRLSRLSGLNPQLANKLSAVNQLLPASRIADMDKLGDPTNCAETLWLEDVSEWTIGVLVKRSVLESLRLDTSVEFVDLATTVIHE